MDLRIVIFLGCFALSFGAELLDNVEIPPPCEEECSWCEDCECETVSDYQYKSVENSVATANYSFSNMKSKKNIAKRMVDVVRTFVEVDTYVESSSLAMDEASKHSLSAAKAVSYAYQSTLCTIIPNADLKFLVGYVDILSSCLDCDKSFAYASAHASAAAEAHAEACGYAFAAASASGFARAQAEAMAHALAEANAYAVSAAVAVGFAVGNSTATAFAKVHVNCSGAFYYYNLTVAASVDAQTLLFTAADAMTNATIELDLKVTATAQAAVTARAKSKAAAGAAAKAKTEAKAAAKAVASALDVCNGPGGK